MSAAPPTREQVARFGHIAARLRAYLKMREMSGRRPMRRTRSRSRQLETLPVDCRQRRAE